MLHSRVYPLQVMYKAAFSLLLLCVSRTSFRHFKCPKITVDTKWFPFLVINLFTSVEGNLLVLSNFG
ncbi:hypothetical protein GGQ95_002054 [Anoxybacillus rupiensis]|nr:hypothetical protein [Anoxybacillus rupiensis]